jgi:hypothetical protein
MTEFLNPISNGFELQCKRKQNCTFTRQDADNTTKLYYYFSINASLTEQHIDQSHLILLSDVSDIIRKKGDTPKCLKRPPFYPPRILSETRKKL